MHAAVPELPDIVVYLSALEKRVLGRELRAVRLNSPFLLRTAVPPLRSVHGKQVNALRRLGKRIALGFPDDLWLVLHLMVAGRLHWREAAARLAGRHALAAFDFPEGTLVLTEAGTTKRASLHLVQGEEALRSHDRGGLEVMGCERESFARVLRSENHTLKRALTDPRLFSGIGNACSDEILHAACLSPVALTSKLTDDETSRLFRATRETLAHWTNLLMREAGDGFPEKVTAFRPEMAVHGRFGKPCPACGSTVQRIRYAENETNYCPCCQTGGRLLADRSLSRLLKDDWPRRPEVLDEPLGRNSGPPR